ncbi:hypothetical protein NXC12_CH03030 [Rhizobium etli]|uniref:Uncharacterized protein n=1 Tax=Rhizobium etli TaxID=29449 RepID=A0AAN1EKT8_RHIET|nr:hypothetical protein [Rhizobium etli]ARQ11023.1 hypothetical protein NXC12_CH03030 [Rhizobium etli]
MNLSFLNQFVAFHRSVRRYFKGYGGWGAVFGSPIFLISLAITSISYSDWIEAKWVSKSFDIIPNLLGFSLGTYAILFSLMTNRLKRALRAVKNSAGVNYLEEINATFLHFIFVQILCLMWAFLFDGTVFYDAARSMVSYYSGSMTIFRTLMLVGSFTGYLLLIYSVLLMLAAALAVYRIASITDPADG